MIVARIQVSSGANGPAIAIGPWATGAPKRRGVHGWAFILHICVRKAIWTGSFLFDRGAHTNRPETRNTFVSDDWFVNWMKSDDFSVERYNGIVALELIDKAHLAAMTALMRSKQWAHAACLTPPVSKSTPSLRHSRAFQRRRGPQYGATPKAKYHTTFTRAMLV